MKQINKGLNIGFYRSMWGSMEEKFSLENPFWRMRSKNKTIRLFLSAILFLCFLFANSNIISGNRIFFNVNNIYGTTLHQANSIAKDQKGFIWISSKTGIIRLTKDDFRKYQLPYVSANVRTVKLIYENLNLFAYTNNGQFFQYDQVYDQFDLVFDIRQILNNYHIEVLNVLISESGAFYIASSYGVYQFKEGTLKLISEKGKGDKIYIEWFDRSEEVIFIGQDEGIWKMDIKNNSSDPLYLNEKIEGFHISVLYYDKEWRKLWVGTSSGMLFIYSLEQGILKKAEIESFPDQPLLAIEAISDSTVLVGYDGQGLWEMNRKGNKVLNIYREDVDDPSSLPGNGIYDIFNEGNKRVWVCTYSGGASFFEQSRPMVRLVEHQINKDNSLVNNTINDIFEDSKGNIWFATNNGISRWDIETDQWTSFFAGTTGGARVFHSVIEDNNGNIWAGTWSEGVFVFNPETGKEIRPLSRNKEFGNFIFDIKKDLNGDIWIVGVVEKILRYDVNTGTFHEYGNEPVYVIKEYNSNEMLLGCSYGLLLLDKKSGKMDRLLEGYIIHDLLVLNDEIWCATSGDGLIRYSKSQETYKKYSTNSGLPSNFVNSISYSKGFLWLGTENGICRFSPVYEEVTNYPSIIPLAKASVNQDASCLLWDGNLIWGTNTGAILFDPNNLDIHENHGKIFLQDVVVSGKSIRDSTIFDLRMPLDNLRDLTLAYHQNTLTFEVLPIGVSTAESKFAWKLSGKGIKEVWSAPTSHRLLTFANLPGGNYDLKIRLYNNSLSRVIDQRTISIRIKPPFWNTWWFYFLAISFIVGILYFFFRYHINLIQQLHSEEKIRFFTNTAHELRTSLTLIRGPVEEIHKETALSDKGKYYLNLAIEQINNLLKVATQLLDFQKLDAGKEAFKPQMINICQLVEQRILMFEALAKKKNIQIQFYSEIDDCESAVDVGMMEKVIDNLLSNAIKYSFNGGKVFVYLDCNKKYWMLKVKDQGIGISQKGQKQLFKEFYRSDNAINSEIVGSGIGLLMVKNYVEKHGGSVSCESQENVGSLFKIEIPLQKNISFENSKIKSSENSYLEDLPTEKSFFDNWVKNHEKEDRLSVLIVEDNDRLRQFMEVALEDEFQVTTASNGTEAWDIIRKCLPDMVVSDIMMPQIDGFELCRLVKSTYETSHIPLILLTALTGKAEQLKGLGLGADAYLTKPFDINLLIGRIKSIVINRKVIREKALKLNEAGNNTRLMENKLNDEFVKKALEVVKSYISNPKFGKEEFAFEMNVSSSLLYKKMKALTGQSPSDFVKSVRLNYALELLKTGEFTVTEVSEKAGFSSVGYFSTVFKKFYGKSPTEI